MFEGIKAKADTVINDRVTQPIKLSLVVACVALGISILTLMVVASRG